MPLQDIYEKRFKKLVDDFFSKNDILTFEVKRSDGYFFTVTPEELKDRLKKRFSEFMQTHTFSEKRHTSFEVVAADVLVDFIETAELDFELDNNPEAKEEIEQLFNDFNGELIGKVMRESKEVKKRQEKGETGKVIETDFRERRRK